MCIGLDSYALAGRQQDALAGGLRPMARGAGWAVLATQWAGEKLGAKACWFGLVHASQGWALL